MALFHLSVTQTKRSAGQSAIASAAYRAGERLYSEYYGEYSDYTRKGGVICSDILLPSHAPPEFADRQTLWNAVEKAERGKNAQLAYSFDIALQNEFSLEENIALARQFLLENFVSRGMVVDFAVHQPDREDGGIPNPHFHVLCPIRPIEQNGKWGLKQRRVYELDEDSNRIRDADGKFVFNAVPTTDWGTPPLEGQVMCRYDSNRNKENTSLKKEKYLQRIQCYPEFSEKPIALITKKDCDSMIRFIEDSDARVYKRAVLKPEAKEFKTVSCPKIAKECTIREETIERIFRGETVSLDSAQQVATALGKTVEQMFEVEIDRRPMTKKTMREYNLFIRSVLNYANDNYGTSLQMPMIKASGRKGKSVDCLHSDEVEALQAALQECSMLEKAIVLCLLNTGVRRGELAGLTWKDVNFREGTIHVSKSLLVFPNYGYQLTTTKESNIRDVDVAPEFMDFLKDYYAQWKAQKKLMGASWQKNLEKKGSKYAQSLLDLRGNDFVICNDYGFPINPDSYGALVRRVGKKAGIEKIHPHMFRHTFVSILLSNPNIGVATVAAEAGHAQPSTTLAIYTQVYDRRRDEIRKQMSRELYK